MRLLGRSVEVAWERAFIALPTFKYNLRLLSYTRALESPHPEEGSGFHSCINNPYIEMVLPKSI